MLRRVISTMQRSSGSAGVTVMTPCVITCASVVAVGPRPGSSTFSALGLCSRTWDGLVGATVLQRRRRRVAPAAAVAQRGILSAVPRNIEIKARIDAVEAMLPRATSLADTPEGAPEGAPLAPELIEQDDSFYAVPQGRMKLRRFADGSAELIHYQRPDDVGARASDYVRVPLDAASAPALHEALTRGLGLLGRVRKRRWLVLVGPTRIHLDRVEGLGDFIELEVVLREGQPDAEGIAIAEGLMRSLGLAEAPRLAGAYLDLLAAAR